jgi:hypothetical protein
LSVKNRKVIKSEKRAQKKNYWVKAGREPAYLV